MYEKFGIGLREQFLKGNFEKTIEKNNFWKAWNGFLDIFILIKDVNRNLE